MAKKWAKDEDFAKVSIQEGEPQDVRMYSGLKSQ